MEVLLGEPYFLNSGQLGAQRALLRSRLHSMPLSVILPG